MSAGSTPAAVSIDLGGAERTRSGVAVSTLQACSTSADEQLGIIVTGATGNGRWEYSADGRSWNGIGQVLLTGTLLLDSASRVRYVPTARDGEDPAGLEFVMWYPSDVAPSWDDSPTPLNLLDRQPFVLAAG